MQTRFYGNSELREVLDVAADYIENLEGSYANAIEKAIYDVIGNDGVDDDELFAYVSRNA